MGSFDEIVLHYGYFGIIEIVYYPPKDNIKIDIDDLSIASTGFEPNKVLIDSLMPKIESYYIARLVFPVKAFENFNNWQAQGQQHNLAVQELYKQMMDRLVLNEFENRDYC